MGVQNILSETLLRALCRIKFVRSTYKKQRRKHHDAEGTDHVLDLVDEPHLNYESSQGPINCLSFQLPCVICRH